MENTNVETVSPVETALAKENITNQVIQKLKEDYLGLKINGIDDKAGFKAVEDARKHCKAIRVTASKICKAGREEAIQIQKDWIAEEKRVVSAIDETESHLESESNRIKDEEKRILFEAAQKAKLPIRKERLMTIGIEVEDEKLLSINDEDFNALFNDLHTKVLEEKATALKAEEKRIADEKAAELKRIESEAKVEQAKKDAEERERLHLVNEKLKAEIATKKAEEEAKIKLAKEKADNRVKFLKENGYYDRSVGLFSKKALYTSIPFDVRYEALLSFTDYEFTNRFNEVEVLINNEIEASKAKAIADLKIKQEREAKEKAEAELKAAKEAEEKRLREIEETKEAELHKGDAAKIIDLINDLEALKIKYTFKSQKNQSLYKNVGELITKTIIYITK